MPDSLYAEWEVGTYYCAWRITKGTRVILVKNDHCSEFELDKKLQKIALGAIQKITQPTRLYLRLDLTGGIVVDMMTTISDDDEYFHICGHAYAYFELAQGGKWKVMKSTSPTKRRAGKVGMLRS